MGAEDEEEKEFGTDEDKVNPKSFIPKLFCQVGDKTNGWHSKTVQNFATLLLTILSGGQGGKLSISDKSSPKPAWFRGSWLHIFASKDARNFTFSNILDCSRIFTSLILY